MKNIRYSRIEKVKFLSALKKAGVILLGLFIVLSIVPYLLPLQSLPGAPFEPLYENSELPKIGDITLHYRQWGANSAEGVLLVHGFAGSTFSWRYTAPALAAAGYRVVAVDLPGFGLSERSLNFTPAADIRAELLWDLLESLEPGSDWHLVGHSMGGGVVTAMALQNPEQVKSISMVARCLTDRCNGG